MSKKNVRYIIFLLVIIFILFLCSVFFIVLVKDHNDKKIAPENTFIIVPEMKSKICHRFSHDKYNLPLLDIDELPLKDCCI